MYKLNETIYCKLKQNPINSVNSYYNNFNL